MGVLHSIPLCSRGSATVTVEPLDLDKNNNSLNEAAATIVNQPSQPALPPPEATSTPRPQSPTGMVNSQYSESHSSETSTNEVEETLPIDSGLEDTEFEYSKPDLLEDNFDDTLDDDVIDDGHDEIDLNDPVERPPEPTVPDERVASSSDEEPPDLEQGSGLEQPQKINDDVSTTKVVSKEETTRKISSLLSELVGDHPNGEVHNKIEIVR